MNVKELKELLNNFPDEMEVVVFDSSDYACGEYIKADTAEIVEGKPMAACRLINPCESGLGISSDLIKSYLLIGY
jgi:hypothetical protein